MNQSFKQISKKKKEYIYTDRQADCWRTIPWSPLTREREREKEEKEEEFGKKRELGKNNW